ncbi:MAG: ABC transporter substrate-binding protein [Clostridiales bacterium]|nr:ABC transporter substrate-binding protein [Clostridiales bacterium]
MKNLKTIESIKVMESSKMTKNMAFIIIIALLITIILTGCSISFLQKDNELQKITVLLDWVPNTNHTGLYVASEKGWFADEGLDVTILQPPEGGADDVVAAGRAEFGISYQEQVTFARTADSPLPIKAVAAIIQHNTSGFASPADKGIKTSADFEGRTYGGWGSPVEEAMLKALMAKAGADFSKVKIVNIGASDFFSSVMNDVDFSWIFFGWDGVAAGLKDFPINFIRLTDIAPELDYYTPVIIAGEKLLKDQPELVKKFLRAVSKGYEFSISNPDEAAAILLKNAPEIDKELAMESQRYLAAEFKAEAGKWGVMKKEVWDNYADWLYDNGLLKRRLLSDEAFTNEFLP